MSMTEAQMRDAYREAQHILQLDGKWQQLMPGERKPNFRRAAREIVKRALGHKVRRNEKALDINSGLMHEHGPREAALLERSLKNGMLGPEVLHSFTMGSKEERTKGREPEPPRRSWGAHPHPLHPLPYKEAHDPDLPDVELYIHDSGATVDYPSHYEPGAGVFHSSVYETPTYQLVQTPSQSGARLESSYKAVH